MSQPPTPVVRQRTRPTPSQRKLELGVEAGTIEVTRGIYNRGRLVREDVVPLERIRVPVFTSTPARVRVEGSITRNLGDFNSARVSVAVELPCHPEESEIHRVAGMISDWLDVLVPTELTRAIGGDTGGNPHG